MEAHLCLSKSFYILKVVFFIVLSFHLQVCNVLITVSALHISSGIIKGPQRLGKVGMMEQANLKASY